MGNLPPSFSPHSCPSIDILHVLFHLHFPPFLNSLLFWLEFGENVTALFIIYSICTKGSFLLSLAHQRSPQSPLILYHHPLLLLQLTCLWRLSLSSSESTQPTLPSPPHTRIRNVTNFWKRRRLRGRRREWDGTGGWGENKEEAKHKMLRGRCHEKAAKLQHQYFH